MVILSPEFPSYWIYIQADHSLLHLFSKFMKKEEKLKQLKLFICIVITFKV